MIVMDELTEPPHRTPSSSSFHHHHHHHHHVSAQSPRVGGCVGAFFHLFDWNPSKRLFSNKRLTADRPNQEAFLARRDRGFKERTNSTGAKPLLINEEAQGGIPVAKSSLLTSASSIPSPESSKSSDDANRRVPGVVARLMGLESLPDAECSSSKNECHDAASSGHEQAAGSPPVLLQELLRQEMRNSKKSLKEKLPGFAKRQTDAKPERGGGPPRRKPATAHGRGDPLHPYVDSRAPKVTRHTGKKAASSSPQDELRQLPKQPFLARLQTGNPALLPSKSLNQNSSSPLRSPSKLGSKSTTRLLEAAVKILEPSMQPSPRSRYVLQRELQRDSQSESGASSRSEKKASSSGYGRAGSLENSSSAGSRSLRGQSLSRTWNGKDDRGEQSGRLVVDSRHDQASRRRFEVALAASARSVSPPRSRRARPPNPKRGEGPPRGVLGTHEASIRGFKIDLGSQAAAPTSKNGDGAPVAREAEMPTVDSPSAELEVGQEETPSLPDSSTLLCIEGHPDRGSQAGPGKEDQDDEARADADSEAPCHAAAKAAAGEKLAAPSGGFRSIRFRSRAEKLEKDLGAPGNRVFPSEKHVGAHGDPPPAPTPPKEAKAAGAGLLSYSRLFSTRKQGDKKEGNGKGEALVLKRTENALMRSLRRRPTSTFSPPPPPPVTKPGGDSRVRKSSKGNKTATAEAADAEPEAAVVAARESPAKEAMEAHSAYIAHKEGSKSPNAKRSEGRDGANVLHARYRSVDDVFPELPMEESDAGAASPDLGKTVEAVEDQFMGFGLQGETALFDCRSIERMFGKGISRAFGGPVSPASPDLSAAANPAPGTSPVSPEVFITECGGAAGALPYSPLVKYEKMFFSSRGHPNLQELFEAVSGDWAVDPSSAGVPRRAMCPARERGGSSPSDDEDAGADVDTCSNTAVCDTGGTPERLEIQKMPMDAGWSEDAVTPISVKKAAEKTAAPSMDLDAARASGAEECGQPSPVSVLESPFLDEAPTTPDASLAGSEHQADDESCTSDAQPSGRGGCGDGDAGDAKGKTLGAKVVPEIIETDKIKQAILEISRFRNIDATAIGLEAPAPAGVGAASVGPREEQSYVREVLDAADLLADDGGRPWHAPGVAPMNPSLFDRLEFGSIKLDERALMESKRWGELPDPQRQGSGIRSERKLLFDCVNEAMALSPWARTSPAFRAAGGPPAAIFPELPLAPAFRPRVSGERLVQEVYGTVCHWRGIAGNVLDDLIDYDMSVPEGRWVDFGDEVADVALDVERMLLKAMIEELVTDLSSISAARGLPV